MRWVGLVAMTGTVALLVDRSRDDFSLDDLTRDDLTLDLDRPRPRAGAVTVDRGISGAGCLVSVSRLGAL